MRHSSEFKTESILRKVFYEETGSVLPLTIGFITALVFTAIFTINAAGLVANWFSLRHEIEQIAVVQAGYALKGELVCHSLSPPVSIRLSKCEVVGEEVRITARKSVETIWGIQILEGKSIVGFSLVD